jgi:hypothetical protein
MAMRLRIFPRRLSPAPGLPVPTPPDLRFVPASFPYRSADMFSLRPASKKLRSTKVAAPLKMPLIHFTTFQGLADKKIEAAAHRQRNCRSEDPSPTGSCQMMN